MDGIWTTILSVILSAAITTVIGMIIKGVVTKELNKQEELRTLREEKAKAERKKELNADIERQISPINEKLDTITKKLDLNEEGTVACLRSEMKSELNHCREQGWASSSEKANWNQLYNEYTSMGGNHFKEYVDEWKNEMNALPSEDEFKRNN